MGLGDAAPMTVSVQSLAGESRIGRICNAAWFSNWVVLEPGTGREMVSDQPDTRFERLAAAAAHPLAELLECPREAGSQLNRETRCLDFESGQVVFRQLEPCQGLYVVVSGDFLRKAERFEMRVTLGSARPGGLVELAAALGDGLHSYTLSAVGSGSLLLLPLEALHRAFETHPPLRMRLLEELAREVSRAYITCCLTRVMPARRHSIGTATA